MVTGRQFGDGEYHEVEVRRSGRTAVVWVDGLYVARVTAPGLDMYLDVHPSGFLLGGMVGASSGTVVNGFRGCLRGATVDGKLLPLSESNEDFGVSYSGLGTPTFGCWVPPTGPITTETSGLPLLYIIIIVVVVALLLVVVACVVTMAIAHRCRKTRKRTKTSVYEMRDLDFVLRPEAGRPRLTVEYHEEEQGIARSSVGNIRSYDHEGGGESDVGMLQLDVNSAVSHTVSTDDVRIASQFSTFSSVENHSIVRAAQPAQPPPVQLTRPPKAAVQSRLKDRSTTRTEAVATGASAMAEPSAAMPRELPVPAAKPKPVSVQVPQPMSRAEAVATSASAMTEPSAAMPKELPVPAAKPKPVSVQVPQPMSRTEAVATSASAMAEPSAAMPMGPPVPAAKPKPVNVQVPQPMSRTEAVATGASAMTEPSAAMPKELPVPAAKPKPVSVQVPQPMSRTEAVATGASAMTEPSAAMPKELPVPTGKPKAVNVPVPQPKSHSKSPSHLNAKVKQIWKRKEAADAVVLQDDFDEITPFADEGHMTPLGYASLRSLYRMQDTEDDDGVPTITGPSAPRFSHLLALLRELNVTDDDDVSSTCTADTITSGTIQARLADQSSRRTPPPIPVKKHKSQLAATGVSVRQV